MEDSDAQVIREGFLYWCDTARSNIGTRFSDKARRPVLVVAIVGSYAAVYPCSRYRGDLGASEWVGEIFGADDTHIIFGSGLYYVPLADLQTPGIFWQEWPTWRKIHRQTIAADREKFQRRHRERLATPVAGISGQKRERLSTSFESLLSEEVWQRLNTPPEEPPIVPPPPAPEPKKPPMPRRDEFELAVESLPPYLILKPSEEEDAAEEDTAWSRAARRKRKGRRQ